MLTQLNSLNIWKILDLKQQNGIKVLKEELGIENMLNSQEEILQMFVGNVEKNLHQSKELLNFAQIEHADKSLELSKEDLNLQGSVLSAIRNFIKLLLGSLKAILVPVVANAEVNFYGKIIKPVYNLKTQAGVYYANGILVSNCDSFTMALNYLAPGGYAILSAAHNEASRYNTPAQNPQEALRLRIEKATNKIIEESGKKLNNPKLGAKRFNW